MFPSSGSSELRTFLNVYAPDISKEEELVLCDAQTSGGLLAAVAPEQAQVVISSLKANGVLQAAAIGRIDEGASRIKVVRQANR